MFKGKKIEVDCNCSEFELQAKLREVQAERRKKFIQQERDKRRAKETVEICESYGEHIWHMEYSNHRECLACGISESHICVYIDSKGNEVGNLTQGAIDQGKYQRQDVWKRYEF